MTGLRKSGRGGVDAPDGDPEPARLIEPTQKHVIIEGRMAPCQKGRSIAKNRPCH
jgi:hypothetical protein